MGEICIAKDFENLYNGKHTIETCIEKKHSEIFRCMLYNVFVVQDHFPL